MTVLVYPFYSKLTAILFPTLLKSTFQIGTCKSIVDSIICEGISFFPNFTLLKINLPSSPPEANKYYSNGCHCTSLTNSV